jgi:hypothetical protein
VIFGTDAPFSSVCRVRTLESVSLLCWASATPRMPSDADAFGSSFGALLAEHVLPQSAALGCAWRAAVGCDASTSVPFRVTARRSGVGSECVTRQQLACWLAEAWHDISNGSFVASAVRSTRPSHDAHGLHAAP